MQPYSVEQSIIEGVLEVKELFEYAQNNAAQFEAYKMERDIFAKVMQIGLAAMKCYFAEKGTGDIGAESQLENGKILKKETRLYGRDYFSVFSKIKVPRTCYRFKGEKGVMPSGGGANVIFLSEPIPDAQSFFYPPLHPWPVTAGMPGNFSNSFSLLIHCKDIHQHA